ncbi:MAG: NAD-dependent malic enzyme [Gammaproteobacteria bacterium]|nr:NAD-dependent malic enzyme [Gammaproteobacteria bacterium]
MLNPPEGRAILRNPLKNKDIAFTQQERDKLGLHGLLPAHESTLEEQCRRAHDQILKKDTDLEKHIYLRVLQDTNEVLFYALLTRHIEEMMPLVYTPTVGAGCVYFSHIYRHPRGLFLSYPLKDRMKEFFAHPSYDSIKTIVVTDGERILGLGDQGANGMGIPIGKLSLYTACAGIHPATTLPIMLDVGTNNPKHLADPLYIGWHHERIQGKAYDDFIDQFVTTIKERFPHVLLQWEDFAQQNANPILARYRDQLCTFNDDIQGTAAVTTGTLLAAINVTQLPLTEQRIAVLGAGSAGCGISSMMMRAMCEQGLTEAQARERFFLIDRGGVLQDTQPHLFPFQQPFAKSANTFSTWKLSDPNHVSLEDVIRNIHPTVLIGVSGQASVFTEPLIKDMAAHVKRPVIFPLSNPTSHCEATPHDLLTWTQGRAIIGTGSPFAPVKYGDETFSIAQTNNAYIFPGLGLGALAAKASRVSDSMFMAAATTLAEMSPAKLDPKAPLLPRLNTIREVSKQIAFAVAKAAFKEGLSVYQKESELEAAVEKFIWEPVYT